MASSFDINNTRGCWRFKTHTQLCMKIQDEVKCINCHQLVQRQGISKVSYNKRKIVYGRIIKGSLATFLLFCKYQSEIPNSVASKVPKINCNHADNFHNFSFTRILNNTEATKQTREMTKPIIEILCKLSIITPANTCVQKYNVVLKYLSQKKGEAVQSGMIWLNKYEQRRIHANMGMFLVHEKTRNFLSDSQFININPGPWISSVIKILLSEAANSPPVIYIRLTKM